MPAILAVLLFLFSSKPREFMSTLFPLSSSGFYRTLAFLSNLLSSVCREMSQAPCDIKTNSYTVRGATLHTQLLKWDRTRFDSVKILKTVLQRRVRNISFLYVIQETWSLRMMCFHSGEHHAQDLCHFCGNCFHIVKKV